VPQKRVLVLQEKQSGPWVVTTARARVNSLYFQENFPAVLLGLGAGVSLPLLLRFAELFHVSLGKSGQLLQACMCIRQ
jgi:hypothetical protein